jgi:hypothetical protein
MSSFPENSVVNLRAEFRVTVPFMPSIDEIKQRHKEVGGHFFDDPTMRFFDSRISSKTYGNYFVTSECGPSGLRRYTVRRIEWDTGDISTVGHFHEYDTLEEALSVARKMANV